MAFSDFSDSSRNSFAYISESRRKLSLSSLLNPAPRQTLDYMPSSYHHLASQLYAVDGSNRCEQHTRGRSTRRSFRESPYPPAHERARRHTYVRPADNEDGDSGDSSTAKRRRGRSTGRAMCGRITMDAYLDGIDREKQIQIEWEKQAHQPRVEWLKSQAEEKIVTRSIQHPAVKTRDMAKWLADFVCDSLLLGEPGDTQPGPTISVLFAENRRALLTKELRGDLKALLRARNPLTCKIFLALLYIRKLFPSGLHTMIHRYPIDNQAKLIFRAFCLALFLAFKWLDDFRLHIGGRSPVAEQQKSESPKKYRSCWADFLSMSVAEVRIAEISALNVLNWNISVSAPEWHFWLDELHDYTVLRPDSASFTTAVDLITTAQEELGRTCPEAPFMSSPPRENSSRSSLEPLIRALLVGIAPPVLQSSSPVEGSPELEVGLHCPQPILAGGLTGVIGYVAGPSPRTVTQSDYEHLENPDLSLEHLLCEDIRSQDWQPFDDPQLSTPVFVNPWRCQTHHDFGELYLY